MQPNINQQFPCASRCDCSGTFAAQTLPVTNVDPNTGTLTVADGYASLADVGPPGNFKGARWRLFAPPGTITGRRVSGSHTDGAHAGTLSRWVGADSSRCLYAGYQYESPLAGFWSTQTSTVKHRQQGLNLAGQHYTLFRHYDPTLMRFTSPDPAAEFFYNLNTYGGNSPARYYDPDGESILGMIAAVPACVILGPVGVAIFAWQAYDTFKGAEAGSDADGVGGSALGGFGGAMFGEDTARGALNHGATGFVLGDQTYTNSKMALQRSGSSTDDASLLVTGAAINLFERTGVPNLIRFGKRRDPWTGRELSNNEANLAGVFGVLQLGTTLAAPTFGAQMNGGNLAAPVRSGPAGPGWKMGPSPRGKYFHKAFGENLPSGFKTIDKMNFSNGKATSIKSVDLRLPSMHRPGMLDDVLARYINKVAGFNAGKRGRATILPGDVRARELLVVVPKNAATPAQRASINRARELARGKGVRFVNVPAK